MSCVLREREGPERLEAPIARGIIYGISVVVGYLFVIVFLIVLVAFLH
jgi:hypothetical protein